jgi:signal transduction histidine kinase
MAPHGHNEVSGRYDMSSLSSRLLVLTIFFVMVAEILIFVPSIARFRQAWLFEKLGLAHLAILAVDAAPDRTVSEMMRHELLSHVGAIGLSVRRAGARLILSTEQPPPIDASFDIDDPSIFALVRDAFVALTTTKDRVIRVVGPSPRSPSVWIELVLHEKPLHQALTAFAWRIFGLSIVISLITATLVYVALQWMIVRPMRRLTENMVAFREDPEDAGRVIPATRRRDEIGTAQRELAGMQQRLRATLAQRAHLAALGTAVAKINHDLRGILASALLVSDRLGSVDDPEVRRVTPTLFKSIQRAVDLCSRTLDFVGQDQPELRRSRFYLRELVQDVEKVIIVPESVNNTVHNDVTGEIELNADRDQLFRILTNLFRNAAEAGAETISVSAESNGHWVEIDIADNGPGLPPRAREKLFRPFEGSARAGGTGLGLAIARELVRGHGGDLTLIDTDKDGTHFRIALPQS